MCKIFRAFNFRHLSYRRKIFNSENFPIYDMCVFFYTEGDEIKHHQHSQEKSIYHSNQEMLSHTDEKDSILLTSGIQELGPQLSVIPIKEEGASYSSSNIIV